MISFAGPAEVRGRYQNIRNWLQPVLIIIFLFLPWLKVAGQPVLLFDVLNRHFIIFGLSFYSHEAPLLFFFVILILLAIFIVTALYGRLWCGWACPQTVFLHSVFNRIEKLIMGPFAKRRSFYMLEGGIKKQFRIAAVYAVFLLMCWLLAHSFAAYFTGADVILRAITEGPAQHRNAFIFLMAITGALFFNFTFFREKLCLYVCPYGRFQNTLIDNNSWVVTYDGLRGEPRSKKSQIADRGDCIDCSRCVNVCPVKIDIRNGFQWECIACGMCVDACNEVMQKVKRPEKLIRYETGDQRKTDFFRFRIILYGSLFAVFLAAFLLSLAERSAFDVTITRSHQNTVSYRSTAEGRWVQNQLQIHIKNQTDQVLTLSVDISTQNRNDGYSILGPINNLSLQPHQDIKLPAFIEIQETRLRHQTQPLSADILIEVRKANKSQDDTHRHTIKFFGGISP